MTMIADWSMYVPRRLAEVGFAGYEPIALPHFLAALETAGPGAVFDIGLNVGPYALMTRAFSDREVVGFEPTPDLARVARECAVDNDLAYTVEELALGAEDGTARLYLSDSTDSSNSLNPTFRQNSFVIDVPLETLDSYVERTGIKPAVLKVDTETTEPAVLAGAARTVQALRSWVLCEVLAGQQPDEIRDVIADWGYTWYNPGRLGPSRTQARGRRPGRVRLLHVALRTRAAGRALLVPRRGVACSLRRERAALSRSGDAGRAPRSGRRAGLRNDRGDPVHRSE